MNEFLESLKQQAKENPLLAIAAGSGVVTIVTKLIRTGNESVRAHAWKKEVNRRINKK